MMYRNSRQSGMTLLEVIISLSLVVVLVVTAGDLLRRSMDVKHAFSSQDSVNHRIIKVMNLIANDLEHAYIIPSTDLVRLVTSRTSKTIFKIEEVLSSVQLSFTTTSNVPLKKNMHQADTVYIVYSVEKDSKSGRLKLFRALGNIPESFSDLPKKQLITGDLKQLEVKAWNGEDWVSDKWDSTSGDHRDTIPKMIKIDLSLFEEEYDETKELANNEASSSLSTVVYLPYAEQFTESKKGTSSINWDKM